MLTCLCDAFFGDVGIATVKVLEHVGCEVVFPEGQTCCGQPPFNAGDWNSARRIADHCRTVFDPGDPIVTPSGSCAAMLRDGYRMLYPESEAPNCFELGEFLVHSLGLHEWPAKKSLPARKVAFHRACHLRALGLKDEQEMLVRSIPGLEFVELAQPEQCCGFGGAFAATHGATSAGIGTNKLADALEQGAQEIVSGDMGCLMHLNGLIAKSGARLRTRHYSELLAESIA